MPSALIHDSAMWAAPVQYERSTTSSSTSPASTRTRTVPPAVISASATAPRSGSVIGSSERRAPARSTDASAQPAARRSTDVGGPGTSTSSTVSPGAIWAMAPWIPEVRTTRTDPVPSASAPPANGGRLGPIRTTSSRFRRARTGRPCWSASRRAAAPTTLSRLAAEGPAVGERRGGLAAGSAPRGVGLQVGRLDPRGAQRRCPLAARDLQRGRGFHGRATPLHLAGRGPGLGERLADRPAPARRARRRARPAGPGRPRTRRGPAPPQRDCLHRPALDVGSARRRREVPCAAWPRGGARSRGLVPRVEDGAPAGAPAQVGERGPARQLGGRPPAASACRPSRRQTMPGGAEAALAGPGGGEARRPSGRSAGSRPSTVVMDRPATRRAGVTQATRGCPSTSTVQHPHWPCGLQPSFGERSPRSVAEHVEQRPAVVDHLDLSAVDLELERGTDCLRPWPEDRFSRCPRRPSASPVVGPALVGAR